MEKQEQLDALKSLSSMIISFLSVVGIILTLIVYFIVSPSIASLKDNSKEIFSSVISMSDILYQNSKATNYAIESQKELLQSMKRSVNNTLIATRSVRESALKIQSLTGYDLATESAKLKQSEDELAELLAEVEAAESKMSSTYIAAPGDESMSTSLLKAANEFSLSLSSLEVLFAGTTLILIILFLCMIILSAEGLLI
ncbi:MAG: hypothetical protein ACP5H8_02380 [Candidatus Micrarchaeia archaeon]